MLKVIIDAEAKEIADLILAIQGQQLCSDIDDIDDIAERTVKKIQKDLLKCSTLHPGMI